LEELRISKDIPKYVFMNAFDDVMDIKGKLRIQTRLDWML